MREWGAYQVPALLVGCFLTRFLTQDELGSTRKMDGGRACCKAGLILHQISWAPKDSKRGKAARQTRRSCSGSVGASDLRDMRMARRSRVDAMACAVGAAGSCVAMKSLIVLP